MSYHDKETGLVEPKFMKAYIEDLGRLKGLTGTQRVVLDRIMYHTKYGNEIVLDKKTKNDILDYSGVKDGTFRNILTLLVKKGVLKKGYTNGIYVLNPDLAYRGKQDGRARLIIEYNGLGERSMKLEEID